MSAAHQTDDRVAIIVPCFNGEKTLAGTLESALAQDAPVEIVVVDDGSRDASLSVARAFEPLVRVISGPNRGVSSARNSGIALTSARWIIFLDADDWLEPDTLKKRLATAKSENADVTICDWIEIEDNGGGELAEGARRSIDWAAIGSRPEVAIAHHAWATTAAILYSRKIVDRIGGFSLDLPVIQDARFLFDAAYHGARFAHSPHVGARYRVLPNSLSRSNAARFWRDVLVNGRQIEELWRARGSIDGAQIETLAGIYNNAARGLFATAHPTYFDAVASQRRLGAPLPRHSRLAPALARLVGLNAARSLFSLAAPLAVGRRRARAPFSISAKQR